MTKEDLIELLNEDLALAFRAHVQTVSNVLTFDDESLRAAQESRRDQIKDHVDHTIMLARQVAKLGGLPVAHASPAHHPDSLRDALTEELALETIRLARLRTRAAQARELGVVDTAREIDNAVRQREQALSALSSALGTERLSWHVTH